MSRIGLADMIEELRNELQDAVERGKERSIRFALGEITLDVEVVVEGETKGSVKFWVFTGVEASGMMGRTQKISLKLQPKGKNGEDFLVGRSAS